MWKALALVSLCVLSVFLVGRPSADPKVQVLEDDPMAVVEIAGTHEVERFTREEGEFAGFESSSRVLRTLALDPGTDPRDAVAAAERKAEQSGWVVKYADAEPPSIGITAYKRVGRGADAFYARLGVSHDPAIDESSVVLVLDAVDGPPTA